MSARVWEVITYIRVIKKQLLLCKAGMYLPSPSATNRIRHKVDF